MDPSVSWSCLEVKENFRFKKKLLMKDTNLLS